MPTRLKLFTYFMLSIVPLSMQVVMQVAKAKNNTESSVSLVQSNFGYSMYVPKDWLVLLQADVADPAAATKKLQQLNFSDSGIQDTIQRIGSGSSEMLFLPNTSSGKFSEKNNVNIIQSIGVLPSKDILPGLCEATQEQISSAFQRDIVLDFCEYRRHGPLTSVYLEFEGLDPSTRNAQYHLHNDDDFYLVFSLTAVQVEFQSANNALARVLNSIEIKEK